MKAFAAALICTVFITAGGSKPYTDPCALLDDLDEFNDNYIGMSVNTVHVLLGKPSGGLSGMWGDIYFDSDNEAVIIYYNSSGCVELARYGGWSKPNETENKNVY